MDFEFERKHVIKNGHTVVFPWFYFLQILLNEKP